MITAVNYHLWEPCNMRCKFCFATFQDVKNTILPKGHLPEEEAIQVVEALADYGFQKITFAGGEPTLCKWLTKLIQVAKMRGMTTMIVTNGTNLNDKFLEENRGHLDWIALSVDSLSDETNINSGRAIIGKKPITRNEYIAIANRIKKYGYGFKINTVIHAQNYNESFSEFIQELKPERWKIFQVLPIIGQNDFKINDFKIDDNQFESFKNQHKHLEEVTTLIYENNNEMKGSYAMVDPAGRFYDNAEGKYNYSQKINEIGVFKAINQVNYSSEKFIGRGGAYNWERKTKNLPLKITLSGTVASGKSTIGKLLADKLSYSFVSIGNRTREYADKRGFNIVQFQKECLNNPNLDKEIDVAFSEECNSKEKLIVDYRLGFKFISNAFHVFLSVSESSAIDRLKNTKRTNETHVTVKERNSTFQKQFLKAYGVDYTSEKHYDLIINTDQFNSANEIVEFILDSLVSNETFSNEKS